MIYCKYHAIQSIHGYLHWFSTSTKNTVSLNEYSSTFIKITLLKVVLLFVIYPFYYWKSNLWIIICICKSPQHSLSSVLSRQATPNTHNIPVHWVCTAMSVQFLIILWGTHCLFHLFDSSSFWAIFLSAVMLYQEIFWL